MDERWEKVWASLGEPDYDIDNDWPKRGEWVLFSLEVHFSGELFWSKQFLTKADLEEITAPDLKVEKWIWEEMIEMIDVAMDRWQKTGEHCVF